MKIIKHENMATFDNVQKPHTSLEILDFHKHGTDRGLVSVGNDFLSKHNESYSAFEKFSDFV